MTPEDEALLAAIEQRRVIRAVPYAEMRRWDPEGKHIRAQMVRDLGIDRTADEDIADLLALVRRLERERDALEAE